MTAILSLETLSIPMMLITLCIFLAGVAVGMRHVRIGGLFLLFILIFLFAGVDYALDRIVVWPYKSWLIVDLIAAQLGYLTGAAFGMHAADRKKRKHGEPN